MSLKINTLTNNIYSQKPLKKDNYSKSQYSKPAILGTLSILTIAGSAMILSHGKIKSKAIKMLSSTQKTVNLSEMQATITKNRSKLINNILSSSDSNVENVLKTFNFTQYSSKGLPLKYPRDKFVKDIDKVLSKIEPTQRANLLKRFGLIQNVGLDGIPIIPKVSDGTKEFDEIAKIIRKFTIENETTLKDKNAKTVFDSLVQGLPEFTMMIGKKQHGTHIFSVDIHSLDVLQKSMLHPKYQTLSDESKMVLKLSAFMHDFGKMEKTITKGHATISKELIKSPLENIDLPQELKDRVIKQIENHHWFENFNKLHAIGLAKPQEVTNIFGHGEDLDIAKMLAKSDFSSVNPEFHLRLLEPNKTLTPEEFNIAFEKKMSEII